MRRFALVLSGLGIGIVGMGVGAVLTLKCLPSDPGPTIDPAILTTRTPAPQPVVTDGSASDEGTPSPAVAEADAEESVLEELAPAAAPLLVSADTAPAIEAAPVASTTLPGSAENESIESIETGDGFRIAILQPTRRPAAELVPMLELTGTQAIADALTNRLVLRGTEQQLRAARYIIANLDGDPKPAGAAVVAGEGAPEDRQELRIYHCPAVLQEQFRARIARHNDVLFTSDGDVVAISASPSRHAEFARVLEELAEAEVAEAAPKESSAKDVVARSTAEESPATPVSDPVVIGAPVSEQPAVVKNVVAQEAQVAGPNRDMRVSVAAYRIATEYLAGSDLNHLAENNPCVKALREWLGKTSAGRFASAEVDACVQLLLGLGVIAPGQTREVPLREDGPAVRLYVDSDAGVKETAGETVLEEVRVRPASESTVALSLGESEEKTEAATEFGASEAALALLPVAAEGADQPDVLVIVRPVQAASARSEETTRR